MFSHFILIISDSTLRWMQCILKDFTIVLAVPLNPVMGFTPTLSDGYFYLWICICVFVYLLFLLCIVLAVAWLTSVMGLTPKLSASAVWFNSFRSSASFCVDLRKFRKPVWKGFKRCLFFLADNLFYALCPMPIANINQKFFKEGISKDFGNCQDKRFLEARWSPWDISDKNKNIKWLSRQRVSWGHFLDQSC